jgi:hypothetical protein
MSKKLLAFAVAETPTANQYGNLQLAYDYFNNALFDNELPACLLVFGRDQKNCYGYFHAEQWENAEDKKQKCHMISLTPMHLSRPLQDVFGTLVHEMAHLWQQEFGKPSKNGYHNREWADRMIDLGLYPSSTGAEGGKETGPKVSHYIVKGGPYQKAFQAIPDEISLPWIGAANTRKKKVDRNKVKYICLGCNGKVWGKPGMSIVCGECDEQYEEV